MFIEHPKRSVCIDETGNRYDKLLVLERDYSDSNPKPNRVYWKCQCDCGNVKTIAGYLLRAGRIKSCGCAVNERGHNPNFIDETGNVYGKLTVIKRDDDWQGHTKWLCQCECGSITSVLGVSLRSGKTLSCGCVKSRGEYYISVFLANNHIKFEREKIFTDCKDERYLPFDFYLPDYKVCIEYQGQQHYEYNPFFGSFEDF